MPLLPDEVELRFYKVETTLEELVHWAITNGCMEEAAYLMSAEKLIKRAKEHVTAA